MDDTSVDTETWEQSGKAGQGGTQRQGETPKAMDGMAAEGDTTISTPWLARALEGSFNKYGSNLKSTAIARALSHSQVARLTLEERAPGTPSPVISTSTGATGGSARASRRLRQGRPNRAHLRTSP